MAQIIEAITSFWELVGPGGKLHPAYFLEHKGHLVIEGLLLVLILYLFLQHSFKPRPHSEEPLTDKVGRAILRRGLPAVCAHLCHRVAARGKLHAPTRLERLRLQEINQLIQEWKPEPLVPTLSEDELEEPKLITGWATGLGVQRGGTQRGVSLWHAWPACGGVHVWGCACGCSAAHCGQQLCVCRYDGKHVVVEGKKALNLATYNFLNLSGTKQQLVSWESKP